MPSEIAFPSGLRRANADVVFEPVDIAKGKPMDAGEQRRRPRFRSVPQVATVTWRFDQTAFDIFWDWYERELRAGEREFDLELERQGGTGPGANPRLQWWTAQFVEPPRHESTRGYRYTISARLMLRGQPFDARVALSITASGTDGDAGGWQVASRAVLLQGTDGDGGGWVYVNTGALIFGTDGDAGGWEVFNGLQASGADGDAGGWTQPGQPIVAGDADGDTGAWTYAGGSASLYDPRVDALLLQGNGFVVLRDGALITRQLVPGSNVSISNPTGQAGNPVISSTGGGAVTTFRILAEDGSGILGEDNTHLSAEFRVSTSGALLSENGIDVIVAENGDRILSE